MIEKIVLDYLSSKLDIPIYLEEPKEKPKKYIVLENTGTSGKYIKTCLMAIKSYDETLYKTAKLDFEVQKVMHQIIELNQITKCEMNSSYNYTDTETKRYRYQSVYDIFFYSEY